MGDIALESIKATFKEMIKELGPAKPVWFREDGDLTTDTPALVKLVASSLAFGIVLHQIAKRSDIDRYPLSIFGALIGVFVAQTIGLQEFQERFAPAWASWQLAGLVQIAALSSLALNLLVYRAYLHPLKAFPGPVGASLTKFWSAKKVVESGDRWYQVLGGLQAKYGDYVRTGPREITIFNAEAIEPILGFDSKTLKGPVYGASEQGLHSIQEIKSYNKRRVIWQSAFKQNLEDYGTTVEETTNTLLTRIQENEGKEVLLNELCKSYSYDVMSKLAFGKSGQFLEANPSKIASKAFINRTGGALLHVPWLVILKGNLWMGPNKALKSWTAEQVHEREKVDDAKADIIGHLIRRTEKASLLREDASLIITAGGDTVTSALTILFVLLATNPSYQHALQKEVSASLKDKGYNSAKPQPQMDDIIAESLRLFPPVMFSPQRIVPEGGLKIGKVELPEDTIVNLATYQIQRDSRNFVRPNEFVPERWSSRPELVLNQAAFIPFSKGPFNCPGRGVAMMEIRSVLARTVQKYDILIPDRESFNEKTFYEGITDSYSSMVPECKIMFKKR